MPCIGHFRSQTYHSFDRYRLFNKPLGWTTILLVVLYPAATTYTVLNFRDRWQASYCTGYNLAIYFYRWQHISGATCWYKKYPFPLWYWESTSYKHMVASSVFQLTSYTSLPPLRHPPTTLSITITSTMHTYHPYMPPHHTIPIPT